MERGLVRGRCRKGEALDLRGVWESEGGGVGFRERRYLKKGLEEGVSPSITIRVK